MLKITEDVQTRLAKEMPVVLVQNAGKTISGTVIEDFLDDMSVDATSAENLSKNLGEVTNTLSKVGFGTDGEVDTTKGDYKTVATAVAGRVTTVMGTGTADLLTTAGAVYENGVEDTLKNIPSSEMDTLISDNFAVKITEVNKTPTKVSYTAVTVNAEANEMYQYLVAGKNSKGEDIKSIGDIKSVFIKILGGINVVSKTVKVEDKDYLDEKENIKPLEVSECLSIAKKLKEKGKNVDGTLSKIEKAVKAVEKTIESKEKAFEKSAIENNDVKLDKAIAEIELVYYKKNLSLSIEQVRATSTGNAAVATELGRSKFGHIVKESIRLMKKK